MLKIGHRVTVLAGVSDRMDEGSLQSMAYAGKPPGTGIPRTNCVRKRGEVVAIDDTVDPLRYLVDDQIVNGQPQGACTMREWFVEAELELG